MANYLTSIRCGDSTYHLSASGQDVYFDKDNKSGGRKLRGAKFINNEMKNTSDSKVLNDFSICQLIKSS